ncbi:MAG TPA: hypothetical protein VJZ91_10685, partial [Blastocatellia bacterium]|nr:hypothetical protein [Blastocatellia bacterium]
SEGKRASKSVGGKALLTDRARAELLSLFRSLQDSVAKPEAKVSAGVPPTAPDADQRPPRVHRELPPLNSFCPSCHF